MKNKNKYEILGIDCNQENNMYEVSVMFDEGEDGTINTICYRSDDLEYCLDRVTAWLEGTIK